MTRELDAPIDASGSLRKERATEQTTLNSCSAVPPSVLASTSRRLTGGVIRKPAPLNWAGPPRHWHIRGSESAAAGDHLRLSASGSLGPIGGPSPPRPAAASESRRGRNPDLGPPIYTEGNHTRDPPASGWSRRRSLAGQPRGSAGPRPEHISAMGAGALVLNVHYGSLVANSRRPALSWLAALATPACTELTSSTRRKAVVLADLAA
jgi:hypothetical protein